MRFRQVVAVVGAGFSGALASLQLLNAAPDARVLLIDKAVGFGRGLAYSTQNPQHLLNVRVANMSAWPDDPDHLRRWLARRATAGPSEGSEFISRGTYGAYIADMLSAAVKAPDGAERLVLVYDEVVRLEPRPHGGFGLLLGMGRTLAVDAVVLALGGLAPAPPVATLSALPKGAFSAHPWADDALNGLEPRSGVVMIGTGLTMVDVVLSLEARGHRGPILALSRRGLLARRHQGDPAVGAGRAIAASPISWAVRRLRNRSTEVGWRQAVDELRPFAQQLWRSLDVSEQRRFLRHLRPWWDVHRHRMAPAVAERIDAMIAEGRLKIAAGSLRDARMDGDTVHVAWIPRGSSQAVVTVADRIVNCAGPSGDVRRLGEPLVDGLLDSGAARPDALGLGLDVASDCRVIDASGRRNPRLFAVGPLTRGAFWEVIAVPDIRRQVSSVASRVAAELGDARTGGSRLAAGAPVLER
jgi:uncharacterized NAD(P)/FAD-binding protein YdhS